LNLWPPNFGKCPVGCTLVQHHYISFLFVTCWDFVGYFLIDFFTLESAIYATTAPIYSSPIPFFLMKFIRRCSFLFLLSLSGCTLGGYPPMSTILAPKQANADMPFLPALDYKQMNGLGLNEIEDDTFDCVLVKGTVDAMLCAGHAGRENALLLLAEAYRVLKPTGIFICIRYAGGE
jgi:SAM-dependent methyltransferase